MKGNMPKEAELEVSTSGSSSVEIPSTVKNIDEIRFYVRDLCFKIEELENRFDYVPASAYDMLAKYTSHQNSSTEKSFNTIL